MKSFGLEKESSGQTLFQFRTNFKSCFYDFGQKSCVLCRQHRFIVSKKMASDYFFGSSGEIFRFIGFNGFRPCWSRVRFHPFHMMQIEWLDEDRSTQTI